MTDFVYDNTSLPDGKSDLKPLSVPPGNAVTAAEWNTSMQAIRDTRAALLAGKYHGLESNPAAGVGTPTQALLRSNNGALEVSEGGGAFHGAVRPGEAYPRDFGAVGDGAIDDTAALQACFNSATLASRIVVLDAGKTYRTTAALRLGTGLGQYVHLEGRGATLQCDAVCTYVLGVTNDVARIRDLHIGAARVANVGLFYRGASASFFENVTVYQPLVDGFQSYGESDRCVLINCKARLCGKIFHTSGYAAGAPSQLKQLVTGTVDITGAALACVVTRASGSLDFTSLGVRYGDMLSVHATTPGDENAQWLQVSSVDSPTQITCTAFPRSAGAATGLQFSIHVGDAYHEGPLRADNNIHRIDSFLGENCAGAAAHLGGLYGPRVTNLQANACFGYPVVLATSENQTIGSSFNGVYFELCEPVGNFFFGGAAGVTVDTGNVEAGSVPTTDGAGFSWGTLANMQNAVDPGRVDPVDATTACYWRQMVIGNGARLEGPMYGRSYLHYYTPGGGYLKMADNDFAAPWRAVSGLSWLSAESATSAFLFDSDTTVTRDAASLLTKHFHRWSNNGAFIAGVGVDGDYRTTSSDTSGKPGNATIHKPSGRVTLAAGASAVTITSDVVKASSHVLVSKHHNDATALTFKVVPADGSFTVTFNAIATSDITLDFFVVNVGT